MTSMRNNDNDNDNDDSATNTAAVARALEIHRSIAACHEHIARHDNIHAHTAALMLPCYQAEFRRLALALTHVEARELRYALDARHEFAA